MSKYIQSLEYSTQTVTVINNVMILHSIQCPELGSLMPLTENTLL